MAIVGGGPAGATLGRLLAAGGARVVLLERCRLPRYKPCGGGLTARSLALLPPSARALARQWSAEAVVVCGRHRLRVRSSGTPLGLVCRETFDHHLVELAAAAGVQVRDGVAVTAADLTPAGVELRAGGDRVRARFLACADGATGPFAGPAGAAVGLVGCPRRIGALEVEVQEPAEGWPEGLRADFDLVPRGYGWVFPKAGTLSVGVASWADVGGRTLREALRTYLRRLGLGGQPVLRSHGHPIPVGGRLPVGHLAAASALRLGDAAGLADPLFGEGIAHALTSAHLAAPALLGGDLSGYGTAVARDIYRPFRAAAGCARLFYPAPGPWFLLAGAVPGVGDRFFRLALGGGPRPGNGGRSDAPAV